MHGVLRGQPSVASEMQGQFLQGRDKIVPPPNWVVFARWYWPEKTAANLAALDGKDERTGKRWLAGEFELPTAVSLILFQKMFERGRYERSSSNRGNDAEAD